MSRARTIATGAAVLVSGVFAVRNLVPGGETFPFVKTKGVSNIEQRYTAGGGTPTHTAGTATIRGSHENVIPREKKVGDSSEQKSKGVGTAHWDQHVGDQWSEGGKLGSKFNEVQYGTSKGK